MSLQEVFAEVDPKPGTVLDELSKKIRQGGIRNKKPSVETLSEQKERAEMNLDKFLSNIASSPGARKVVEQFYREKHDRVINASELEVLKKHIPSVDSILYEDALPVVSKDDLRNHFGVEGIWGIRNKNGSESKPYLAPEWVRNHPMEPYLTTMTSGTTGKPWGRAFTRNDWAVGTLHYFRLFDDMLREKDIRPNKTNAVIVFPPDSAIAALLEVLNGLGVNVELANFSKLRSGGQSGINEGERLVQHINSGKNGMVVACLEMIMTSKIGVEIRRDQVDVDLFVNAGKHIQEKTRNTLESKGTVENIFGETEYPQGGGRERIIHGKKGFDLPFDSQINMIYDRHSGELSYEGSGRFAYFMFGSEGHIVPGVYVSGVTGTIQKVNDTHQLIKDIKRVKDPDRGCYEPIY